MKKTILLDGVTIVSFDGKNAKKTTAPLIPRSADFSWIPGRSTGLSSSYSAPSRFGSGLLHFVRITVAGTARDSHPIPCYPFMGPGSYM